MNKVAQRYVKEENVKKIVEVSQVTRMVNCGMLVMVTAACDGKTTITPCAWHMPVSKNPPVLGVALAGGHFSSELIRKSKKFVINIPGWELLDKVILCGSCSGREKDKFEVAKLTPEESIRVQDVPGIGECAGNIECFMEEEKQVGDHSLFLGKAVCARARENCFRNGGWDTGKIELIFHLGAKNFFKSSPYKEKTE